MRFLTGLVILISFGCEEKFPRGKIPQISTKDIDCITTILYNNEFMGVQEDLSVSIPKTEWQTILALTLPHKWTSTGPDEIRIGTVTIKYRNKKTVSIAVFWVGKNPCMVSLDGKNYFYAKENRDNPDGAAALIRKVIAIHKSTSKERKGTGKEERE